MILELRIPNELQVHSLEVRILKGLRDDVLQQRSGDTDQCGNAARRVSRLTVPPDRITVKRIVTGPLFE